MSYCRFSPEESDVYVFGTVATAGEKIECCGCRLVSDEPAYPLLDAPEMLKHLEAHRQAGHLVPEYAMERLRREIDPMNGTAR